VEPSLLDQRGEVVVDVVVAEDVCKLACGEPFVASVDQGGDGGEEVAPPGEVCTVMLPETVVVEFGYIRMGEFETFKEVCRRVLKNVESHIIISHLNRPLLAGQMALAPTDS